MLLYSTSVPWVYYAGINDFPRTGTVASVFEASPHTLFSPIIAGWGELNTPIAFKTGAEILERFGYDCFSIDRPYYNYQSVLVEEIGAQGTPQYVSRMEMEGMAQSNSRLSIEYAENSHVIYERTDDGGFSTDVDGNKIPTSEYADGYIFRLIAENIKADFSLGGGKLTDNSGLVGLKVVRDADGNVLTPDAPTFTETAGTKIPFIDVQGRFMGDLGNRILTHLFAPEATDAVPAKTTTIEDTGAMMYRLGHMLQNLSGGGSSQVYGVNGEMTVDFALKPNLLNTAGTPISFEDSYDSAYELTQQTYTGANKKAPCLFSLYEDNIATLQALFHASELAASALDVDYPCWLDEDEIYSINILEGRDHYGVPYHSLALVASNEQPVDDYYSPYQDSYFGMSGGSDGDMSNESFNTAVANFANNVTVMFPIHDKMEYQIGWFYDMGLDVATKNAMYNIMFHNESFIVVNATEEYGVEPKSRDDTIATAISLNSGYSLFPESSIYKTAACRGVIVPFACTIKNHKYRKAVPVTFSLAKKINAYIGYSTKIWNESMDPMLERNKVIDEVLINFESLNFTNRSRAWANNLVVIDTIQHQSRGFVGLQTIFGNENSTLNNLFTIIATGQAVRAGYEAGVVFSGQTGAPSVIAQRHMTRILEECNGIDRSKATVSVLTYQTEDDYNSGHALTSKISVASYGALTTTTIELESSFAEE